MNKSSPHRTAQVSGRRPPPCRKAENSGVRSKLRPLEGRRAAIGQRSDGREQFGMPVRRFLTQLPDVLLKHVEGTAMPHQRSFDHAHIVRQSIYMQR
jgi:hypothetical protein